jgi:Spx/MgsR family transcriptional regulator
VDFRVDAIPGIRMATTTLYGLPNCDTCRKARRWQERVHIEHEFVDYRANPIPAATLKQWAAALGGWEQLINKSSTTWRQLLPQRKNPGPGSDPEWTLLLKEYPALIRRPVVVLGDGTVSVGFTDNAFKRLFPR